MSKQRARRRAEREAERERAAAVRAQKDAKRARRRGRRERLAAAVPRPVRYARQGGLLARRSRIRNGSVLVLALLAVALAWVLSPNGWARLAAVMLAALITPILMALMSGR